MKKLNKTLLLGILVLSLGTGTVANGMTNHTLRLEDQLQEAVVLPIDYHDKVFMRGEYSSIYDSYKVELSNNRTYLPIRLMAYVISDQEEQWQANWDPNRPNEVVLFSYNRINTNNNMNIKLQVDSKTMIRNGEEVTLSDAPKKIGGRIVLPVRAIGEALSKQINYSKGLVFLSDNMINLQGAETEEIVKELKERLQDPRKPINYGNTPNNAYNIEGKTYYTLTDYDTKTQIPIQKLYNKQVGKAAVLEKEVSNYVDIKEPIVNNKFYFAKNHHGKMTIYSLDLKTKKELTVAEFSTEGADVSWISRIIHQGDQTYFIIHYGDLTMGGDALYSVENGKLNKLTNAKYFGSLLFEGDKIYFSEMNFHSSANNLYEYNLTTKATTKIGEEGYVYDVNRVINNGATSLGIANSATIINDKLYTIGYLEDSQQVPALYQLDLQTGESKRLTDSISGFWVVEGKIYYRDITTKYLYSMNLQGDERAVVVKDFISDIKYYKGKFYYTLSTGLYKYVVAQNTQTILSSKKVKDFFIHPSRVYLVTTGYDAGLYKIENGKTVVLEKQPAQQYLFDGEHVIYKGIYEKDIKILR